MFLASMKPTAPPLVHLAHVDAASVLSSYGTIPHPISMPPSKRPKLSLQTSSLPTPYGPSSSTTSNKVENMSTATPTTLNTFNNTFDLTLRPSPNSSTASPNILQRPKSNVSTSLRRKVPYDLNLPLGVRPILKNSDLFHETRHGSLTTSASPRSTRKVFFPPSKRVVFAPIDEEIVTHTYVARHVDLSSSEEDLSSDGSKGQDVIEPINATDEGVKADAERRDGERDCREDGRGRRSTKRSSSSHRSQRKKRRWEWTIESLNKTEGETLIHAQKTNGAEEAVLQPPLAFSVVEVIDVETEVGHPSLNLGAYPAVEETPQNPEVPLSTTPKDDPPSSPWMVG